MSGPARTDRRRAGGAGPRGLLPAADARCLSLASQAPESTAHATGVQRRCRTNDVVNIALEKCSRLWHYGTHGAFDVWSARGEPWRRWCRG